MTETTNVIDSLKGRFDHSRLQAMSSGSDSEDDKTQKQRFLQAADSTFFTNALFQPKKTDLKFQGSSASTELGNNDEGKTISEKAESGNARKSQRYLAEDEYNVNVDINVPETVREHVYKKLVEIMHKQVEFCDLENFEPTHDKVMKNKLRLLKGANCYVNPYEDFVSDYKRPDKKPVIKKRIVDPDECEMMNEQERLKAAVIEPESLLNGTEIQMWAKKPERSDKYFRYKLGINGRSIAIDENEFSKLRRKNNWDESKIKRKTNM